MKIAGDIHFSYCTNIHPGESWEETFQTLKNNLPLVKEKIVPFEKMGIGLRLSARAAGELLSGNNLSEFKYWLSCYNLYVFTINGFPYGDFHHIRVKDDVHKPDWQTGERLLYTRNLIDILSELLPEKVEGSISTSPLSYRPWYKNSAETEEATVAATKNLVEVAVYLKNLEQKKNILIHIDIEPEPDGFLENSGDVAAYYTKYLLKEGIDYFSSRTGISGGDARNDLLRYIRICYDVCHFALAFECIQEVMECWRPLGIQVGKIQISAALEARLSGELMEDQKVLEDLFRFDESTYLHQLVAERKDQKSHLRYPDLSGVDKSVFTQQSVERIRVHFHVPVFIEQYGYLASTQQEIKNTLAWLKKNKISNHWEVETYTWTVLPADLRFDLPASIAREMQWIVDCWEQV